jgi:putative hemolysin
MDLDADKSFGKVENADTGFGLFLILLTFLLSFSIVNLFPDFSVHPFFYSLLTALAAGLLFLILAEFLFFRLPTSISRLLHYISLPFSWTLETLADLTVKSLGLKPPAKELAPVDLMQYISGKEEEIIENENGEAAQDFLQKAVEFPAIRVNECMVPRTEIVAIEENDSINAARELFIKSGHSKLPVYKENIDEVTGYIHLIDLFHKPDSIAQIVMPIVMATESMSASDLLKQLIDKHRSLAVVVDEFGGTAGIITIEDILEEIVGEIQDEHDTARLLERKENPGEYYFSARLEIDYLNESYNLILPKNPDYETLAGLIFYYLQNIPKPGDILRLPPYELKVISMEGNRINDVRVLDKRISNY